ncbi:MAG: ATP-dependent helicase, partial [Deltaproteobacteria bacterium]|nr:ATP-dependent helicase [Deltaproteobacteria bacterium]
MRRYVIRSPGAGHLGIDYRAELNEEQLQVVMAPPGPILVIAGAGSGKTRTVTYRVARLIDQGADAARVLLVTFTNKAAREMLHRVQHLVGPNAIRVWGGTFHHIANRVLRQHAKVIGYESNYSILDREDAKDLLKACLIELGVDTKARRFPAREVLADMVSFAANTVQPVREVIGVRYPYFEPLEDEILAVADRYARKKRALNVMDFDDLLLNWRDLLAGHTEVREYWARYFQHVLVDEYQDTNRIQAEIVDLLAAPAGHVMVVGDDSQSIYAFRGANYANILEFPKRYPEARLYKLQINYRSSPEILALANASLEHNIHQYPKELKAVRPHGPLPSLVPASDVIQQAEFVAQRLLELRDEGIPLHEMSVLYRAHYHSMELQMELTRRGIPFQVRSGLRFFEQAHVKDLTSYLKVACNPYDELAWKRILRLLPKIGPATADKVWQRLSQSADPVAALAGEAVTRLVPAAGREGWRAFVRLLEELRGSGMEEHPAEMIRVTMDRLYETYLQHKYPDYESRMEDIYQLMHFAEQYNSAEAFLSELALMGNVAGEDVVFGAEEDERVILTSIHQAKGLEWRVVF